MPSRRPTSSKPARRVPRLKLVPAPKGKKTVARKPAPAKRPLKAKLAPRAQAAVKGKLAVKAKLTLKAKALPKAKAVLKKPAPLALVPPKGGVKANAAPLRGAAPALVAAPVERVPREQLLARYTPLIKYVVERLAVGLPKNVDHEDLMSAGMLGLLDAYDKFDSGKGTKFETYAVWRIKGAVLDQLRALDWASRSVRRKAREVEASVRRLDQRLGRAASEEEIAKEAKMPLADYHRLMDQVRGAVLLSLDEVRTPEDGDSIGLADLIEDPSAPDVLAKIEEEETRHLLLETLNQLPEQERVVVALYYYEHMTLREIGLTLGISESRVSQVHSRAVIRLKSRVRRALAA
jgi:RNA polymerase sigma factor for flagellar operon FliA